MQSDGGYLKKSEQTTAENTGAQAQLVTRSERRLKEARRLRKRRLKRRDSKFS
jgi:hypothetical protein